MKIKNNAFIIAGLTFFWVVIVILLATGSHFIVHRFDKPHEQPVQFSHTVHVNQLNLECTYCHAMAEKSIHATIPAGSLCLDCHEGADIDRPEAKKMLALLKKDGEIHWNRVFQVKDHVYFSHRVHTVVAKLKCQECHGSIENMTVAVRTTGGVSDRNFIEMGWCLSCHKRRGAPRECITCHK